MVRVWPAESDSSRTSVAGVFHSLGASSSIRFDAILIPMNSDMFGILPPQRLCQEASSTPSRLYIEEYTRSNFGKYTVEHIYSPRHPKLIGTHKPPFIKRYHKTF